MEKTSDKILKWATPILLAVLVLKAFAVGGLLFAGTADDTTGLGSIDLTGDLEIDGTTAIDAARGGAFASSTIDNNLVVGAGNQAIDDIQCVSVEYDAPSIAGNGTSSVDVALTGATASQSSTQSFFGSLATSSRDVFVQRVSNTSTADFVNVLVRNAASSSAINLLPVRLNVCGLMW